MGLVCLIRCPIKTPHIAENKFHITEGVGGRQFNTTSPDIVEENLLENLKTEYPGTAQGYFRFVPNGFHGADVKVLINMFLGVPGITFSP